MDKCIWSIRRKTIRIIEFKSGNYCSSGTSVKFGIEQVISTLNEQLWRSGSRPDFRQLPVPRRNRECKLCRLNFVSGAKCRSFPACSCMCNLETFGQRSQKYWPMLLLTMNRCKKLHGFSTTSLWLHEPIWIALTLILKLKSSGDIPTDRPSLSFCWLGFGIITHFGKTSNSL